jgi:glutamine amidotransferase-like uncharacterized protein
VVRRRASLAKKDALRGTTLAASLFMIAAACGVRGDQGNLSRESASGSDRFAPILLFRGTGTSLNDVEALEAILKSNNIDYSTADTSKLHGMDEARIRRYRLLIIPGGNFVEMGTGLTPGATANIRNSVQSGLNYLGICAGGFLAGNYRPPYNGFDLASGVQFHFYRAESRGIRRAAVPIAAAGGSTLVQYWEDGPEFTGWGNVIGRYPDGTPAIVEGSFGNGWVILSGVHPEAPERWRRGMAFSTPASVDHAFALTLIQAALNHVSLSH